jgi:hypothetical protein
MLDRACSDTGAKSEGKRGWRVARALRCVLPFIVLTGMITTARAGPSRLAAVLAQSASTRVCGTTTASGQVYRVYVEKGSTACTVARKLLHDFLDGKGTRHQGRDTESTYVLLRGWKCQYGALSGACYRPARAGYRNAAALVDAQA